jgi:hypothetical protein
MKKSILLKEIQKRLPQDIIVEDETPYDYTEDECVAILSWIKYFDGHYSQHAKDKNPIVTFPVISKRIRLDFGLYRFPCETGVNKGKHVVYISPNGMRPDGKIASNITLKSLINIWGL